MRPHSLIFRLSAATAVAGLVLAQAMPRPALAQPAPPGTAPAVPDQQTGDPPERAGWLSQITGTVSFHTPDEDQWSAAAMNYPVATGDSFWTEPNASAQIMISDSRIALAGGTELDVGTLDPTGLQATLPQGEIYVHLRNLAPNETWSVQTPRGLMTFSGAGRYDVVAGDTQTPTAVTVVEGSVQVTGTGVSLRVAQGQTATITGTDTFQGSGGPAQQDVFLTAMLQAERPPPAPAVAPPPVVAQMPGGDDLSAYGSWSQTTDYGNVWYPQVSAGWAPYSDGRWAYVAPWGWTWVDAAPWGFAPFHYGRWFQTNGRWGWTPGVVAVTGPPVYAPALVAFVGIGVGVGIGAALASGSVGWVPLGPREAYYPWYHTSPNYVRSVNRLNVTNITVINNRNVTINNFVNRSAVVVVPAGAMAASRPVRQVAEHVDPHALETARPVIGTEPIRPTAITAGITPRLAQRLHLPPAPPGVAAVPHVALGPAIHAGPLAHGVAARPELRNPIEHPGPVEHPGVAPEHGGAPPAGATEHAAPGARPGPAVAPGAMPAPRTPAEREGGVPPTEHAAPGPREGAPHEAPPAQEVRPGAPPAGSEHPGEVVAHPPAAPPAEHPAAVAPHVEGAPQTHATAPEVHAAPRPEERAAPRPEVHAAPRPEEHVAPRPEEHAAPRPAPAAHEEKKPEQH
jgi:FecR protein